MTYHRLSAIKKPQMIFGTGSNTPDDTNVRFINPHGGAFEADENDLKGILMKAGTIKNFKAHIATACGAGKSLTFTIRKNTADTAVTLTISGASDKYGSDLTHTVHFAAEDEISIEVTPAGTPTVDRVFWGLEFLPD